MQYLNYSSQQLCEGGALRNPIYTGENRGVERLCQTLCAVLSVQGSILPELRPVCVWGRVDGEVWG